MKIELTYENIKDIILTKLTSNFSRDGIELIDVEDDTDLFKTGLIDSLDFIELIEALEENHGLIFDFSRILDPEISILKVLVNEVLRQNILSDQVE